MEINGRLLARRAVVGVLVSVAGYYAFWGGEYTAFDLGRLGVRQNEEMSRLAETRAEVDSLRALAEALESDPLTIERVARERFGMVRTGETLYRFVEIEPERHDIALAD